MPLNRFVAQLAGEIAELENSGTAKGLETIVREVIPARDGKGSRVLLMENGGQPYLRMNSNSYLGMSTREKVIKAGEKAAHKYGAGPGAVRFISGTYEVHRQLEERLARFHGRQACMVTNSAYTSILGLVVTLTTPETIIISDELNHNSIINAMRLARPKEKKVYHHLNMADLEFKITDSIGRCESLMVITDGVFSMRGAFAPLDQISTLCEKYDSRFPRGIVLIVDDSHGVGAIGRTGRGTEEITSATGVDIIVATLGKALGVNGGYIVSRSEVIRYLREKNPFYIYTNPITPPEAAAATAAIDILDSPEGIALLSHLRLMTEKFSHGLAALGYETIESAHPVVPLLVRDTARTAALVTFLREHHILATGLNFPIVPRGDQLIRFQVTADHTESDIDYVLSVLKKFVEL